MVPTLSHRLTDFFLSGVYPAQRKGIQTGDSIMLVVVQNRHRSMSSAIYAGNLCSVVTLCAEH